MAADYKRKRLLKALRSFGYMRIPQLFIGTDIASIK